MRYFKILRSNIVILNLIFFLNLSRNTYATNLQEKFSSKYHSSDRGQLGDIPDDLMNEKILLRYLRLGEFFKVLTINKRFSTLGKKLKQSYLQTFQEQFDRLNHVSDLSMTELKALVKDKKALIQKLLHQINQNDLEFLQSTLAGEAELNPEEKTKVCLAAFMSKFMLDFYVPVSLIKNLGV